MKLNKVSIRLAAAVLAAPLSAIAQSAPQAASVVAKAPGKIGEADAIQIQGKVKAINKKTRNVTLEGPNGNQLVIPAGEEVKNFDQIRIGDLVTITYVQALVVELKTVENNGIRERRESTSQTSAPLGSKPSGTIE